MRAMILCVIALWVSSASAFNQTHVDQLRNTRSCPNCDLSGYNFYGVDLTGVNLTGANLTGANLTDANPSCAYLSGAKLDGAIGFKCY